MLCEPGTPGARNATLPIEQDLRADIDWLGESALLIFKPRLRATGAHGLVLQWALATFIAYRAIEGVIQQQELHHAFLCISRDRGGQLSSHLHPIRNNLRACWLRFRDTFDINQTHPACRYRLKERVITKTRNLNAKQLSGADYERAFWDFNGDTVNDNGHQLHLRGEI